MITAVVIIGTGRDDSHAGQLVEVGALTNPAMNSSRVPAASFGVSGATRRCGEMPTSVLGRHHP